VSTKPGEDQNWVGWIANEIATDTGVHDYWADTAIIVVWDDWGGWYDHILPQFRTATNNPYGNPDPFEYGLRTPLLVISQWAKKGIHHGYRSQASILKFIEKAFKGSAPDGTLGPLGTMTPDTDPFNDDLLTAGPGQDPLFDLGSQG
jgi:phospholipase C